MVFYPDNMSKTINIRGQLIDLAIPRVMGILNITPDSFYKGSRLNSESEILNRASLMLESGADILDIGAYSSRPGADDISEKEELERLTTALTALRKEFPSAILSLDTFRSTIADIGVSDFGVDIINDISGGAIDSKMFDVIEKHNLPYILMHMKGKPRDMHISPVYEDLLAEILKWFSDRKQELVLRGVRDIIIDPGFGFGKTVEHNFTLLDRLERFHALELPLLAGLSRKTMIWKTLEISPEESLTGTIVLNTIALMKGVSILRVHDVREAVQAIRLVSSLDSY
ncbi:MAG: dihydropteroate synthase [Bacteroidales bacterium]|nr:dihydropteroate synthase [Bacteroidales bacterium]